MQHRVQINKDIKNLFTYKYTGYHSRYGSVTGAVNGQRYSNEYRETVLCIHWLWSPVPAQPSHCAPLLGDGWNFVAYHNNPVAFLWRGWIPVCECDHWLVWSRVILCFICGFYMCLVFLVSTYFYISNFCCLIENWFCYPWSVLSTYSFSPIPDHSNNDSVDAGVSIQYRYYLDASWWQFSWFCWTKCFVGDLFVTAVK